MLILDLLYNFLTKYGDDPAFLQNNVRDLLGDFLKELIGHYVKQIVDLDCFLLNILHTLLLFKFGLNKINLCISNDLWLHFFHLYAFVLPKDQRSRNFSFGWRVYTFFTLSDLLHVFVWCRNILAFHVTRLLMHLRSLFDLSGQAWIRMDNKCPWVKFICVDVLPDLALEFRFLNLEIS